MKHWSVDTKELKKDKEAFAIWQLEQRINFGIGKAKIKKVELLKYWDKITLDPLKRHYLALVLGK